MKVICTGDCTPNRATLPQDSDALVTRMTQNLYRGEERRSQTRFIVATHVQAQAVDDRFNPVGKPFRVILRDISSGGVCLLYPTPIESRFVAVTLDHPTDEQATVEVIVEIRNRHIDGPMFRMGAAFVPCNGRLDQPHATGPPRGDYSSSSPCFPDFPADDAGTR